VYVYVYGWVGGWVDGWVGASGGVAEYSNCVYAARVIREKVVCAAQGSETAAHVDD